MSSHIRIIGDFDNLFKKSLVRSIAFLVVEGLFIFPLNRGVYI